jgi:hypothetical protein
MSDFADTLARIMELHARYCDAVIRKDAAAFGDCFTEKCEWRISGTLLDGRAGAVARIKRTFRDARSVFISFGTPILDIDDAGRISARTYMNERCRWQEGRTNIVLGQYFERYALDGGRLRFSWRLWQGLYMGPADLTGQYFEPVDYGAPPGMPPIDALPPPLA